MSTTVLWHVSLKKLPLGINQVTYLINFCSEGKLSQELIVKDPSIKSFLSWLIIS